MERSILVPLDGSALAERALPFAVSLARASGDRLVLLRANLLRDFGARPEGQIDPQDDLAVISERLGAESVAAEPHVYPVYELDEVAGAICDAASQRKCRLIVMSTHGRGGLGRMLYGSVADAVLREAEVPVLLVPVTCERTWPTDRPLRLLVALDGSALAEQALGPASELMRAAGAELVLVQSFDLSSIVATDSFSYLAIDPDAELAAAREYLEGVAAPLRQAGGKVEIHADLGAAPRVIAAVARDRNIDLIVMATRGRGGLARLVLGSVATETLHRVDVPTLLVRPAKRAIADEAASDVGATTPPG